MTRLRDDIRACFADQQAELGEIGEAPQRLMREGLAGRQRAGHRVQWAAGIAAVLIAAIVIATLALARFNTRSHAVPASTPSPVTRGLTVADSTPVLLIRDPSAVQQVDAAITWDGKSVGNLPFDTNGYSANPAANLSP